MKKIDVRYTDYESGAIKVLCDPADLFFEGSTGIQRPCRNSRQLHLKKRIQSIYKTNLLHFNNDNRVGRLLDVGAHLAQCFNAHLTGLLVIRFVPVPPIRCQMAGSVAGGRLAGHRKEADRARQSFEKAVQGLQISPQWRFYKATTKSYSEAVLDQVRAPDLIIASKHHDDWDFADVFDISEDIIRQGGDPF